MWLVFALFAFDVDGIAPVSFGKIQEFVDGFDVGDAVGHFSAFPFVFNLFLIRSICASRSFSLT